MHGLYAIVDVETLASRGIDPLAFGLALAAAKPAALQVRDKRHATRDTLKLLRALRPATAARGVLLFANDRPDLAALAGADGVHLGQDDLPVAEARHVMRALGGGPMIVGMSVHDEQELEIALGQEPDYLAFGPVFGTRSKARPAPTLGLAGLARLIEIARARLELPTVAIGSIDAARAPDLARRVDAIAVIAALIADEGDPIAAATTRAHQIERAFLEGAR